MYCKLFTKRDLIDTENGNMSDASREKMKYFSVLWKIVITVIFLIKCI